MTGHLAPKLAADSPTKVCRKLNILKKLSRSLTPMPPRAGKNRTVPKSFRIDEPALQAIDKDAESQNVSLNTLVNQIFKQYADYDRFARKISTVKLSSSTFRGLLSALDADKVIEVAKTSGSGVPQAFATAKSGRVDMKALLDHLRYLATYAHLYEMSEMVDAQAHNLTLIHDFGLNWSIFLVHYVTAMFGLIGVTPKIEMSDRSVSLTVPDV